jgi:hypothetical protein
MRAAAGEGEGGADLELAKILECQCSSLSLYTNWARVLTFQKFVDLALAFMLIISM